MVKPTKYTSLPSAICPPSDLRHTRIDSWKMHLRPLVRQTVIKLPIDQDEFENWSSICDKLIHHHEMDPEPIEEFREILLKTTFPPLEVVTAMSIKSELEASFKAKFDEHIKPFLDRIDKLDSSSKQIFLEIKQLTNQIEKIGNDKKSDHLEKVQQEGIELHCMIDKLNLTASSVDSMDNKVDRLDVKVDRCDTKVENLETKMEALNKKLQAYGEKFEGHNQKMEELKVDIENLERDL